METLKIIGISLFPIAISFIVLYLIIKVAIKGATKELSQQLKVQNRLLLEIAKMQGVDQGVVSFLEKKLEL